MKNILAGFGVLAVCSLGFVTEAQAAPTVTVGGDLGSQAFGGCTSNLRNFESAVIAHEQSFTLAPGTYQPFMGSSTSWRIKNLNANGSAYYGLVKIEIINLNPFGAETVVSAYVRSSDSSGNFTSATFPELPDDQEFGSFTVVSGYPQYIVRATAFAGVCSQAHVFNTIVSLVEL